MFETSATVLHGTTGKILQTLSTFGVSYFQTNQNYLVGG